MAKSGLLIPKYIFVQYQYVLLTKFEPLIPKLCREGFLFLPCNN